MIRKLILPALAVLLLAGCVTGYTHRTAPGDYYYGSPTTVYRDYYYGGYYPYYGRYYSPYSVHGYYRYGYRSPYYYYGRYPGYPHSPRPGNDGGNDGGHQKPDRATPPWRDLGQITERRQQAQGPRRAEVRQRPVPQIQRTAPRPRADYRGSAMSKMIRRAHSKGDGGRTIEE